jgi:hypothetical protein
MLRLLRDLPYLQYYCDKKLARSAKPHRVLEEPVGPLPDHSLR